MKQCVKCSTKLPAEDFCRNAKAADGLHSYCSLCVRLGKYGLTRRAYEAMFRGQGGVCAICKEECRTGQALCVDHCHETGEIRGLLCRTCNTGLGNLGDGPRLVRAALDYLEGR